MEQKEENPLPAAAGVGEPIERRLESAVIQTNEAIQRLADIVAQALSIKEADNGSNP